MKKIVILLNIMFLFCCVGCKNKIEDVVREQYRLQKDSTQKVVDLSKELNFEWDTLYVFGIGQGVETMEEVVNVSIPYAYDLTRVVFFKKDGRIIHTEATPIEDFGEEDVWFHYEGQYLVVPKDSARFFIRKNELGNYILYHVN